MDNFKAVYRILSVLEKAMDLPAFDVQQIGPDALEVSKERWGRYMEMMADAGYIKCLEYLRENGSMRKLYKAAKGIAVP